MTNPSSDYDPEYDPTAREATDESLGACSVYGDGDPQKRIIDAKDDIYDARQRLADLEQAMREGTARTDAHEIMASLKSLILHATLELIDLGVLTEIPEDTPDQS